MMYTITRYFFVLFFVLSCHQTQAKRGKFKAIIQALEKNELHEVEEKLAKFSSSSRERYASQYYYFLAITYHKKVLQEDITSPKYNDLIFQAKKYYQIALDKQKGNRQRYSIVKIRYENLFLFILNKGVSYYIREAYKRALQYFVLAQMLKPQDHTLYLYLGAAHHQLDHQEEAINCYQKALTQFPKEKKYIYYALSSLYVEEKKETLQKAKQAIVQALKIAPYNKNFLQQHYTLLTMLGEVESTVKAYSKSIEDNSKAFITTYHLAFLYEKFDNKKKALYLYKKCIKMSSDAEEIIAKLANMYYNAAYDMVERVRNISEKEFQAQGEVLINTIEKYSRKAIVYYEKIYEKHPKDLEIMSILSTLYKSIKDEYKFRQINNKIFEIRYK